MNRQMEDKRLKAIKVAWWGILKVRGVVIDAMATDALFSEKELDELRGIGKTRLYYPNWDFNQIHNEYERIWKRCERHRPFLDKETWQCFEIYGKFNLRTAFLVNEFLEGKASYTSVRTDRHLFEMARKVLSKRKVDKILRNVESRGLFSDQGGISGISRSIEQEFLKNAKRKSPRNRHITYCIDIVTQILRRLAL